MKNSSENILNYLWIILILNNTILYIYKEMVQNGSSFLLKEKKAFTLSQLRKDIHLYPLFLLYKVTYQLF